VITNWSGAKTVWCFQHVGNIIGALTLPHDIHSHNINHKNNIPLSVLPKLLQLATLIY